MTIFMIMVLKSTHRANVKTGDVAEGESYV